MWIKRYPTLPPIDHLSSNFQHHIHNMEFENKIIFKLYIIVQLFDCKPSSFSDSFVFQQHQSTDQRTYCQYSHYLLDSSLFSSSNLPRISVYPFHHLWCQIPLDVLSVCRMVSTNGILFIWVGFSFHSFWPTINNISTQIITLGNYMTLV